MLHHAKDERRSFTQTLRRVGPDSETLCGNWTTAQLVSHLVLRERSVVELAGRLPVAGLKRRAEHVVDDLAAREPYDELVTTFERGPSWTEVRGPVPIAWFWSLPPVCESANLLEYLVHHEDVRRVRPGWAPRPIGVDVQTAIWKRLRLLAKATLRSVPVTLELRWPSHGTIRHGRDTPAVSVTGDAVELALFAFGRLGVAQVEFDGSPADVDAVRSADISL
jgi:uncharacterized protein (TIGR03085 family)